MTQQKINHQRPRETYAAAKEINGMFVVVTTRGSTAQAGTKAEADTMARALNRAYEAGRRSIGRDIMDLVAPESH